MKVLCECKNKAIFQIRFFYIEMDILFYVLFYMRLFPTSVLLFIKGMLKRDCKSLIQRLKTKVIKIRFS